MSVEHRRASFNEAHQLYNNTPPLCLCIFCSLAFLRHPTKARQNNSQRLPMFDNAKNGVQPNQPASSSKTFGNEVQQRKIKDTNSSAGTAETATSNQERIPPTNAGMSNDDKQSSIEQQEKNFASQNLLNENTPQPTQTNNNFVSSEDRDPPPNPCCLVESNIIPLADSLIFAVCVSCGKLAQKRQVCHHCLHRTVKVHLPGQKLNSGSNLSKTLRGKDLLRKQVDYYFENFSSYFERLKQGINPLQDFVNRPQQQPAYPIPFAAPYSQHMYMALPTQLGQNQRQILPFPVQLPRVLLPLNQHAPTAAVPSTQQYTYPAFYPNVHQQPMMMPPPFYPPQTMMQQAFPQYLPLNYGASPVYNAQGAVPMGSNNSNSLRAVTALPNQVLFKQTLAQQEQVVPPQQAMVAAVIEIKGHWVDNKKCKQLVVQQEESVPVEDQCFKDSTIVIAGLFSTLSAVEKQYTYVTVYYGPRVARFFAAHIEEEVEEEEPSAAAMEISHEEEEEEEKKNLNKINEQQEKALPAPIASSSATAEEVNMQDKIVVNVAPETPMTVMPLRPPNWEKFKNKQKQAKQKEPVAEPANIKIAVRDFKSMFAIGFDMPELPFAKLVNKEEDKRDSRGNFKRIAILVETVQGKKSDKPILLWYGVGQ